MLADPLMPLPDESSQLEGERAPRGGALRAESIAATLEGYAAWKQGEPENGLKLLQAAQRRYLGLDIVLANINWHLRWFIGDLLMEQNRPKDARPYFASLQFTPLAQYRLGEIYEQLGEPEKARAAFAFFLEAWSRADPELQPMVVTARAAVHRLAGLRRQ